jgi:predicted transposase YbfD/YdcC
MVQAAAGARTIDGGHGRIDIRTLHARPGPDDPWTRWPGLAQICRLVHQTRRHRRWHTEVHYKVTSLPPERAGPVDLLRLSRGHWAIENQLHYVRDVTLGEDTSRIRSGATPQVMAAARNLVLAVLRRHGLRNRAAGLRHFAWHRDQTAQVLGLRGPARGRRAGSLSQGPEINRAIASIDPHPQVRVRAAHPLPATNPLPLDQAATTRPLGQPRQKRRPLRRRLDRGGRRRRGRVAGPRGAERR